MIDRKWTERLCRARKGYFVDKTGAGYFVWYVPEPFRKFHPERMDYEGRRMYAIQKHPHALDEDDLYAMGAYNVWMDSQSASDVMGQLAASQAQVDRDKEAAKAEGYEAAADRMAWGTRRLESNLRVSTDDFA